MVTKFIVSSVEAGQRIDRLLAQRQAGLSRNLLRQLFEAQTVWVDGRPVKKSRVVHAGEQVFFRLPPAAEAEPDPEIAFELLLETPELVVVNKPAGLPSVAARGKPQGNVAAALLSRYPEMKSLGHRTEAGLVHRLDTPTSGLMLAARTPEAHRALVDARGRGLIQREYWAIVSPVSLPAQGVIAKPLMRDPKNRRKVRVTRGPNLRRARPAQTEFEQLRSGWLELGERGPASEYALLRISAPRAYRHQIRAHLSFLNSPIVNDTLYGGKAVPGFPAMIFLHSCYVACSAGPIAPFEVRCELPSSFERLLSGRG